MTVVELKEKLIAKINSTNDIELLDELSWIIDLEEPNREPHIISQGELEAVREALEQTKNGQYISDEEANSQIDAWLKK
jgi:hypothetical protein